MKMPTDEKTPLQRQPFKTEENRMKNRHLIALLQDGFTTSKLPSRPKASSLSCLSGTLIRPASRTISSWVTM